MAKRIDWYYHRNNCVTCERSQSFLAKKGIKPAEVTDARKNRLGRAKALKLAKSMSKVVVAKGKSVVTFDMKKPPSDADLLKAIIGPTGNLRAPTVRVGKTLLIGFNDTAYGEVLT